MEISMRPIGTIRSDFTTKEGIPHQSSEGGKLKAVIEMEEEFVEGIADIKEGSYGIVLFYFHLSTGYQLRRTSRQSPTVPVGIFSTRSPNRPNGIGMSVVKFTKNNGTSLEFEGVDMLDGTPVLDIKPYHKETDL